MLGYMFRVLLIFGLVGTATAEVLFSGERKVNNLVSELLEVSSISESSKPFTFTRSGDGWIFISASCRGNGTARVILDKELRGENVIVQDIENSPRGEAMRYLTSGE